MSIYQASAVCQAPCWAHCKPDFVSLPYRLFRQLPWLIISILQWGNLGLMNLSKPAQGHTVLWPQRWPSNLYEELMALTKDRGLRFVLVTLLMQSWGRNRNPELRIPNLNAPMNPREILLKCRFWFSQWDSAFLRSSQVMLGCWSVDHTLNNKALDLHGADKVRPECQPSHPGGFGRALMPVCMQRKASSVWMSLFIKIHCWCAWHCVLFSKPHVSEAPFKLCFTTGSRVPPIYKVADF